MSGYLCFPGVAGLLRAYIRLWGSQRIPVLFCTPSTDLLSPRRSSSFIPTSVCQQINYSAILLICTVILWILWVCICIGPFVPSGYVWVHQVIIVVGWMWSSGTVARWSWDRQKSSGFHSKCSKKLRCMRVESRWASAQQNLCAWATKAFAQDLYLYC